VLDSVVGQQPSEELDSRRGAIIPDKARDGILGVADGCEKLVQGGRVNLPIIGGERCHPLVVLHRRGDCSNNLVDLRQFIPRQGAEAGYQVHVQAGLEYCLDLERLTSTVAEESWKSLR